MSASKIVCFTLAWLVLCPLTSVAQGGAPLQYQLLLDSTALHVTLRYTPQETDSTVFVYGVPPFGGQLNIFDGVKNIRVDSALRFRIDPKKRAIIVYFNLKPLVIHYDVTDTHTEKQGTRGELFRPMISKEYFYSHGINIFLDPQFREPKENTQQSVRWQNAPSFPFLFGFDPKITGTQLSTAAYGKFQMPLVTGATDLNIEKITLDGIDSYIVLRTRHLKEFDRQSIRRWYTAYHKSLHSFWNDYSGKNFSLILQPFLKVDHDISGIAFSNGFVGKYNGDTLLTPHRMFVLSHEIDHHWIGQLIDFGSGEQWFNEGFNDYVAAFVLIHAGQISPDQYQKDFNQTLKDHYSSPIRNSPNDSIYKNYWKLGDYQKLPYRRGNIFAFYLDNEITSESDGKKSIRDFLQDLYAFRKSKGEDFTLKREDFIRIASVYISKVGLLDDIEKYISHGDPIEWKGKVLMDFYKIETHEGVPKLIVTDKKKFLRHFKYSN